MLHRARALAVHQRVSHRRGARAAALPAPSSGSSGSPTRVILAIQVVILNSTHAPVDLQIPVLPVPKLPARARTTLLDPASKHPSSHQQLFSAAFSHPTLTEKQSSSTSCHGIAIEAFPCLSFTNLDHGFW